MRSYTRDEGSLVSRICDLHVVKATSKPVCVRRYAIPPSPSSLAVAKGHTCLRTYVRVEGRIRLDNKPTLYESSGQSSNILEHSDTTHTCLYRKITVRVDISRIEMILYPRKFWKDIQFSLLIKKFACN